MEYIIGWLLNYFYIILLFSRRSIKRFYQFGVMSFFLILITLRDSGTDTQGIYEAMAKAILSNQFSIWISGSELAFKELLSGFLALSRSPVWAVRLIGVVFILLLMFFITKSDKREFFWFITFFIPVFIYQYGMNAIRAGIAMGVFLVGFQYLRRDQVRSFLLLSLLTFFFHYSFVFVFFIISLFEFAKARVKNILYFIVSGLIIFSIVFIQKEYFLAKLDLYLDYKSPAVYSGFSRILISSFLLIGVLVGRLPHKEKIKLLTISIGIMFSLQLLTFWSYAGLRLLELWVFVLSLLIIRAYDRTNTRLDARVQISFILAGFLGAIFFYRNMLSDWGGKMTGSTTPFLPYKTIMETGKW